MTKNMYVGRKTGKLYDVHSSNIVCRRSVPSVCQKCNEQMYEKETDELSTYNVVTYECRNNHIRTVFIDKLEKEV